MITVGAFEAKTKFSELLDRVERGEEIIVTRHGKPVARLVATEEVMAMQHGDLLARFKATRSALAMRMADDGRPLIAEGEIKTWIEDGRR